MSPLRLGAAALLLCMTFAASAATIYRCGHTYSQTPCADARVMEVSDPRDDGQRAESRRIATEQQQLAERLVHEREAMEPRSPALATGFDARARPHPEDAYAPVRKHRAHARHRASRTTDFVAVAPANAPPGRH